MKKPLKDFIPIYVSLAQTYADDKQYKNAILYYNKEIEARGDDATQVIWNTYIAVYIKYISSFILVSMWRKSLYILYMYID